MGRGRLRTWAACLLALSMGCASAAPAKPAAATRPQPIATPAPAPAPAEPKPSVKIKGLTGTLNLDDIHQTMEGRQSAFDDCILASRRRLRWVSGSIRFAFKVGAEGQVEEVHPTESTIGHHALEQCIAEAVRTTTFPKPAGLATASFEWGLTVEPVPGRPLDAIEPEQLDRVLQRNARDIFRTCEVRRFRTRFQITAYVARDGHVLSAGAVPRPARAVEKVDCVLEQFAALRLPKQSRQAKVTFELR